MNEHTHMKHGTLSITRQVDAPRELMYEEIAHGRFENGTETLYTARFHLIDQHVRLICAFDMHVAGKLFSVSLAGVEFKDTSAATELTYTEQAFFLAGDYETESREKGTNGLLDRFASYLGTLRRTGPAAKGRLTA
jgi:uncharacterized protein YndB with AHSA1/START domain